MLGELFSDLAAVAAELALASAVAAGAAAPLSAPSTIVAPQATAAARCAQIETSDAKQGLDFAGCGAKPESTFAATQSRPVQERIFGNADAPLKLAASDTPPPAGEAALPFAGVSDEDVAGEVLRHLEGLTTLSGNFMQTSPAGAVVSGKFYLRRPGQIRFDYDDPSPITIVATGGMVYVENADLETADSYPLKKTPLRFLLSKKIDLGDAALKSVERDPGRIAVTYASTGDDAEGELTLVLAAPALSIEQWAVRDAQGGVTVVALNGVRTGEALENRLFRAPEAGGAFINN